MVGARWTCGGRQTTISCERRSPIVLNPRRRPQSLGRAPRRGLSARLARRLRARVADVALDVDVGLDVDDLRHGLGLADRTLGRVDRGGDLRCRGVARHRDLHRHEQLLGPEVQRLHVDDAVHAVGALERRPDAALRLGRRGLPEQQALGLDGEHDRDGDEQQADEGGADDVPVLVAGDQAQPDADQREHQAEQGGEVLEQDHRQLGRLGPPYELGERGLALDLGGLDDRRPEGPRPPARSRRRSTTIGTNRRQSSTVSA